ncbi:MAG: nitrogen fixation protein [Gammaproteobacteria bacterium RIFOXYA12_FULL_61_12]|nr:MAG: nitrogen fixation protein [Gammaproteobacteria bacterium RIFOXYD12_FULL_61_37]OGT93121.1 MAG: nitrogen fixation protein [Gammaproteobacteria bacterium RIFOXYA12_FULL_61_12]
MKIAVTSQNFREITGHAGKARRFILYVPGEDGEPVEVERISIPKEMTLHEFRGDDHSLFGFDVVITASCGQGFVNRLAAHGVKVIATSEKDPIRAAKAVIAGIDLPPPDPHDHDYGLPHLHPFLLRMDEHQCKH